MVLWQGALEAQIQQLTSKLAELSLSAPGQGGVSEARRGAETDSRLDRIEHELQCVQEDLGNRAEMDWIEKRLVEHRRGQQQVRIF